jgi:hypothetical protein
MLTDLERYLEAFQSSSRAILRLMRLMSNDPRDTGGPRRDSQAVVAAPVPEHVSSTGAARTAKLQPGDTRPRTGSHNNRQVVERDEGHSSSGGHAQALMAGPPAAGPALDAPQSLRRRLSVAWSHRRLRIATIVALVTGSVCGIYAGTRALLGPVPQSSIASAAPSPITAGTLVMIRFQSMPPGARIVDDRGHAVGTTPITLPMTSSLAALSFRFEKDGYKVATTSTVPDGDKTITVELRPARHADKSARKPSKPNAPRPHAKKPSR